MDDFIHLVRDAQTGSPEAFALLVTRFQNMAYAYAFAVLSDFDLAQDAAQEAFVEAYQALPALREPLAFPAWLKRILYKHCDRITRRGRRPTVPLETIEAIVFPQPGPAELVERREMRRQVNQALHAIPANLRTVAVLFYISGYSHQEIADFLGVPVKTVKSRLHTSRQRLKERMLDMVHDEFERNPLPQQFTRETVAQALKHAAELNKDAHYDEAEKLLRTLLAQVPEQPTALQELNRAVMRGRVYGQGRWDLLAELAAQGKTILKTSDADAETVHQQVAETLLAIPDMPEAIAFLESWIAEKGPTVRRLGMLAWAKGCSGDWASLQADWAALLALAQTQPAEQAVQIVPFIAYTLVDCLADAGGLPEAQIIARQAWDLCGESGALPAQGTFSNDGDWLLLWHTAGLNPDEITATLLARHPESTDRAEHAGRLAIQSGLGPPETIAAQWLDWTQACIVAGDLSLIGKYRGAMLYPLRGRGYWREANRLAAQVWELLRKALSQVAREAESAWDWERFNPVGAIDTQDWPAALALVQDEIQARGVDGAVGWAAIVTGACGSPTPPEIVQALVARGVDAVDPYGMFGWYILAREAAHAGEPVKAFDALRKALSYWSNKPYWISGLWEQDGYWGALREDPRFLEAFNQRRQRIGVIYGHLHYFPGW